MTAAATLAQLASSGALSADTSGNVGIGTTTPSTYGTFAVQTQSANTPTIAITGSSLSPKLNHYITDSTSVLRNLNQIQFVTGSSDISNYQGYMTFSTMGSAGGTISERVRINEGGALLIGTTGFGGVGISMVTPGPAGSGYYSTGNSTAFGYHMRFANPNGAVGSISVTASTTAFTTSSDYRLKENIQPMVGALDKISQLKPCTYTWKSDGSDGEGFIAHELQSVIPNAVIGEKDAVDENGEPHYQGVDTSFLVATLTAAIQELKAELDVCKAEIAALKGV